MCDYLRMSRLCPQTHKKWRPENSVLHGPVHCCMLPSNILSTAFVVLHLAADGIKQPPFAKTVTGGMNGLPRDG